tara:strand:- start:97 stop:465 length:369 start_codon:yes stop_codon:yes gene_type:complete
MMKITKRQLRKIIREQLTQQPTITPEQRKIARMFTHFDRDQITQALELNKTLGILPEPTKISFPKQPRLLVDITFATPGDADLWLSLWLSEAGACQGWGASRCNSVIRKGKTTFWIWEKSEP